VLESRLQPAGSSSSNASRPDIRGCHQRIGRLGAGDPPWCAPGWGRAGWIALPAPTLGCSAVSAGILLGRATLEIQRLLQVEFWSLSNNDQVKRRSMSMILSVL
jgi:hypothetical protein